MEYFCEENRCLGKHVKQKLYCQLHSLSVFFTIFDTTKKLEKYGPACPSAVPAEVPPSGGAERYRASVVLHHGPINYKETKVTKP